MATAFQLPFYSTGDFFKLQTLGTENSCYFHAVLRAINSTYIENENIVFRTRMARTLRNLLAEKLDSYSLSGEKIYNLLSKGTIKDFAEAVPEYNLSQMLSTLKGNEQVDHRFQELLCDVLDIDIYIISLETRDIYHLSNEEIYLKNRTSVVILYEPGHYSLLGQKKGNEIITSFSPEDDFIVNMKNKILS